VVNAHFHNTLQGTFRKHWGGKGFVWEGYRYGHQLSVGAILTLSLTM